jgi:flavin-dependent thymidylate synthase
MIVHLAGFNVERSRIPEADDCTPEVISAAYARISRSPKRVDHLRSEARREVDAARRSNKRILFGMGHASVAEHAVFNFDIIGISRYLAEFVQKSRLASFTEKSQRYVTLKGDFVLPQEIAGSSEEGEFRHLIDEQNRLYNRLIDAGTNLFQNEGMDARAASERAREDARYVLSLATETQMGATLNARSLERLLRRLGSLPLLEAGILREQMQDLAEHAAPSLIRYTDPDPYDQNRLVLNGEPPAPWAESVRLVGFTPNPDNVIISTSLIEDAGMDPIVAADLVSQWTNDQKVDAYETLFRGMTSHHPAPECFEFASLTFAVRMSSCCYAQYKRHRIASRIRSERTPTLGVVLPEWFGRTELSEQIDDVMDRCTDLWERLNTIQPLLGDYALTNAHAVQIVSRMNLREWYHFCRLRCDAHAQWEIRALADQMCEAIRAAAPLAGSRLMGKDAFEEYND